MQNEIWHVTFHDCSSFCSTTHPVWNILFLGGGWREEEQEDMPTVLSRFNDPPDGHHLYSMYGKQEPQGSSTAQIAEKLESHPVSDWSKEHTALLAFLCSTPLHPHTHWRLSAWPLGRQRTYHPPHIPSIALNIYWAITLMEVIVRHFTYIV